MAIANKRMYRETGEKVYVEEFGLNYDDFEIGVVIKHWPGRTVTETDNVLMSMLAMNNHPIHMDKNISKDGEWGKVIVSSLVTVSIVGGLSLRGTSAKGIANLGWENIKLPKPVFVGDTLYAESQCLSKRLSKSKQDRGIIQVQTEACNQNDEKVLSWTRSFMIKCEK